MIILKAIFIVSIALVPLFASASPLLFERASAIRSLLATKILPLKGVNLIGLETCRSDNGEVAELGDVYCVVIGVDTTEAAARVERVVSSGSILDGVNIWIQLIGELKPQPRMSGGN